MERKFIQIVAAVDSFTEKELMLIPVDKIKYVNIDTITMDDKQVLLLKEGEYEMIFKELGVSRELYITPEEYAMLSGQLIESIKNQ